MSEYKMESCQSKKKHLCMFKWRLDFYLNVFPSFFYVSIMPLSLVLYTKLINNLFQNMIKQLIFILLIALIVSQDLCPAKLAAQC